MLAAQCSVVRDGKVIYGFDESCITGLLIKECVDSSIEAFRQLLAGRSGELVEFKYGAQTGSRKEAVENLASNVCVYLSLFYCFN